MVVEEQKRGKSEEKATLFPQLSQQEPAGSSLLAGGTQLTTANKTGPRQYEALLSPGGGSGSRLEATETSVIGGTRTFIHQQKDDSDSESKRAKL